MIKISFKKIKEAIKKIPRLRFLNFYLISWTALILIVIFSGIFFKKTLIPTCSGQACSYIANSSCLSASSVRVDFSWPEAPGSDYYLCIADDPGPCDQYIYVGYNNFYSVFNLLTNRNYLWSIYAISYNSSSNTQLFTTPNCAPPPPPPPPPPNQAPVAVATISKDGSNYADSITVTQGVAVSVWLAADSAAGTSNDPNGWTDATNGVSSDGMCEWNRDLNQGVPTFELPNISSPATAAACNISLGSTIFNDAPGTYTYSVLRITDRPGLQSNVDTVSVTVQAPPNNPPSTNNLSATQPDYCIISWPAAIFSWQFTDPDNDTQSAYQIQVDNNSDFSSPEVNTGKILSSSISYATLPGALSWNTTYYWQLKVWDSNNADSSWASGPSFATPLHACPTINFSWTPQNPGINEQVRFTDQSTVYGGSTKSSWAWTFQDGSPAATTTQNPMVKFLSTGAKSVTLRVTDSDGFSCQSQKTINSQLPPPEWKEIPPF